MICDFYKKIFKSSYNLSIIKTLWVNLLFFKKISPKIFIGKKTSFINNGGTISVDGKAYFDCKNNGQFFHDSHIVLESQSAINLGNQVNFFSAAQLKCFTGAVIEIGHNTYFSGPIIIHSNHRVTIGNKCSIAWGVTIMDSDFHSIAGEEIISLPVNIENNVWLGCNVTVLKGVTIKSGCVIAAGSVVTKSTEHVGVYAGNPAKMIKVLNEKN